MSFLKEVPEENMPFERLVKYGPGYLSDEELLAIIIRNGTVNSDPLEISRRILRLCGGHGLIGIMNSSISSLMNIDGIGQVKAVQLIALGEISKRISKQSLQRGIRLSDPSSVADYYMEQLRHESEERVYAAVFDTKFKLISEKCISSGVANSSPVTPREVFRFALDQRAVSLILIHNHPSGDPTPSKDDIDLTRQMSDAGKIVGVPMVDHIIIGDNKFFSMKEAGII